MSEAAEEEMKAADGCTEGGDMRLTLECESLESEVLRERDIVPASRRSDPL